jgi:hypothetical protein
MIAALLALAALVGGAELLTILPAARDSDAGRRFGTLPGAVVDTDLDQARNRRWHRLGALHRAADALLLAVAVVAVAGLPWWWVAPAWAVAGGWSWRRFDVAFAVRFGKARGYLGTTAATDRQQLTSLTVRRVGTFVAAGGAAGWLALLL